MGLARDRAIGRDGVVTVGLVVLCQTAHFLTLAAIPLLLPLIRDDLQISFAQAGVLSGAGMLSYALAQVPAGYLSDRIGPRRLFFAGLLGWSLLSLSFGLIHAFWLAVVNQFLAGAFRALLFAPGLALLASWFPPQRRATAMSLFLLGATAGSILLSLAGPWLSGIYGWRATVMIFAAAGIAAACLFAMYAREKRGARSHQPIALPELFRLARFPLMWVCNGLQVVRFSIVMGLHFWLPSFLVAERGMSIPQAGLVMAMSAALSAPSNILGAYVSDRLRNPPLVIGGSLAILACASGVLPAVESLPLLLLAIGVYSVFQGFYFGPLFLVPMEVLGHRVAGTATGFANLFANIGGFVTVYALGWIKDSTGSFTWGFAGISAAAVVGIALAGALARMRRSALAAGVAH